MEGEVRGGLVFMMSGFGELEGFGTGGRTGGHEV